MPNSVSEELIMVRKLIIEGNMEDALQLVKDIEQKENIPLEDMLRTLAHQARIYYYLGQFENALKTSEKLYQKSQEEKLPFFLQDALFIKAWILIGMGRIEESFTTFEDQKNLFNSIPQDDSPEYQEREINLLIMKATVNFQKSNLDITLDYYEKSLPLLKKNYPYISTILTLMAYSYFAKGELKLALEYSEKALAQIPKGVHYFPMMQKADIYRNMGYIYFGKGELNRALEYHKSALEIYKKFRIGWRIGWGYSAVIDNLLTKNDFNQAQVYLQQFKQITEKSNFKLLVMMYQISQALILKRSVRTRDHTEAEKILKKLVREDFNIYPWQRTYALFNLCELYLEELQLTNEMEILDDINPLIDQLQRETTQMNSYSNLADTKLFQAKLALLQINMVDARKLLIEAQQIADDHGLQRLAGEISREHDRLLEELKLWGSFKKTKASVSERLKLASFDKVIERVQGRRMIEPLESSGQQPVSLLILTKGGVLLFSYPFTDEWRRDDDLFGSFLSAFSMFSDEFFSQGLDRAKFGADTLLLESVGSFSICYLFRGQTYFAKQKLVKFVETLQKNQVIWEILEKFEKTCQFAEIQDLPEIESVLTNVFLN